MLPAQALDLAIVAAAFVGACGGFLWWNAAPARIIMGDTGSLALGGAMAGLALLGRTQLLLPILAGLPLVEALSVIAQVISYRGFRRRVLRMAPIHHHFEVGGWSEFTVIVRFWLFSAICVALGVGIFYADFLRFGRRMTRALVIGLAATGEAVARRAAPRRMGRRRRPTTNRAVTRLRGTRRGASPRIGRGGRRRARPTAWYADRRHEVDLVVPSPLVTERTPHSSPRARPGVAVRSEIDLAADGRACRSSPSPGPTARRP